MPVNEKRVLRASIVGALVGGAWGALGSVIALDTMLGALLLPCFICPPIQYSCGGPSDVATLFVFGILWHAVGVATVFGTWTALRTWRRAGHCGRCKYDLRGSPNGICPECGMPFDPEKIEAEIREKYPPG